MALLAASVLIVLIFGPSSSPDSSSRPEDNDAAVRVEEEFVGLPVGTTVHLCLESMPCKTDVVRIRSRETSQFIALPLPSGTTPKAADGWPLRAYAVAGGRTYRDTTRAHYLMSVDPPCHCRLTTFCAC